MKFLLLCLMMAASASGESNWPRWRGAQDDGCVEGGNFPVKWAENFHWKVPLPGKSCSTPIVFGKNIFLTAPTNGMDAALAFDVSGKPRWVTTFGEEKSGKHRNGSGCNASPATDGRGVFVYFKSGTLAALEFSGKIRWQTNLVQAFGPDTLYWDQGSTPVLTEKFVVMARMHHGESWLAAFDKATGVMRWKVARNYETPVEGDHSYTTPLVIQRGGKECLLVWGGEHVSLHGTSDGKEIWSCGDFNAEKVRNWPTVASPVVADNVAVVCFGRADRGLPRLHGIDLKSGERIWKRDDVGAFVPTPAVYKGNVYILRDRGEVECIDPATGKTIWSGTFPKAGQNFYASPLIAGGKLYCAREDGVVFVANIEGKFDLLAENKMDDRVIASIVPVMNRLLIHGERNFFCVGDGVSASQTAP